MKKKVIALLLAATMVLGLTACGGGDNTNAPFSLTRRKLAFLIYRQKTFIGMQ